MQPVDIRPDHLAIVLDILAQHVPEAEVWVFGSRAKWLARDTSDLDLSIRAAAPIGFARMGVLREAFEESNLPYKVDVVDWANTSESFRKIIERDKVVIQEAKPGVGMAGESARMCPTVEDLPNGWQVKRLGSFCTKIGTGATPRGGSEVYLPSRVSHALIRSQHVFDRYFDAAGLAFISESHARELRNAEVQSGDVLLNITGDGVTFGRACIVPDSILPACVNQHVSIIRVNRSQCDPGYLLSVLSHPATKGYVESFNSGGSRRAITKGHIESFEIPLPPLPEQKAIAHILGTLDDKIELNRRMNATLEAMARALFQSWFVDFDPVRAKLDGRQPAGLDAATAALFPAHFHESPLGHIPQGWRAVTLGEVAKNASITFDFSRTTEVVFVNTGDVLEGDFLHSKRSAHAGLPGQAKKSIRPDDILFSEIRPANKRFAYVDFDSSDYLVSTKFMVIRASKDIHPRLLYRILTTDETLNEFQVQAESRSGTFPQITFDSISHLPIVLPTMKVQRAFQRAVTDVDARIKLNKEQSRTLATLRDGLLPKLLSGELSAKQTEAALEPA